MKGRRGRSGTAAHGRRGTEGTRRPEAAMTAKAQAGDTFDTVKLAVAVLVLAGGVVAFYWYGEQPLALRVAGLLAVAAVSVGIASQTDVGRRAWRFIGEARAEVRKVVWPTRQETLQTTLAVLLMVILVGIFLWLLDMFLLWAVKLLTGQGG